MLLPIIYMRLQALGVHQAYKMGLSSSIYHGIYHAFIMCKWAIKYLNIVNQ